MKFSVTSKGILVVIPEIPEEMYWMQRTFKIQPNQGRRVSCAYFDDGEKVETSFVLALWPYEKDTVPNKHKEATYTGDFISSLFDGNFDKLNDDA